MLKDALPAVLMRLCSVTFYMILSWLLLCDIFMCATAPLYSDCRFHLFLLYDYGRPVE